MNHLHFDESLIFKNLQAQSTEDALKQVATALFQQGLVKESYINAVIEREKQYATGLPTEGIAVAIPHTDCIHVNQKAIAIAVLDKPIEFGIMGELDSTTPVSIIFMLAMDQEHAQLSLLQNLMAIFQDRVFLEFLVNEPDKQLIKEKIRLNLLKGGEGK
ncbi:PTS system, galactitol-specific IIA component [Amphibacillus marinus]|uniref:PTS system, galactitol-specific IIA component n=1 Tax=Amphibacillus marinus TaxID=872970 RepID=A0A1H8PHL4_9BACI|nr:PTS sugar transporter subunit IIA [Amphibacillus marinus]SEO41499.1 PTS system, galactitol-specific IIA component [Amphibacillus marinus]